MIEGNTLVLNNGKKVRLIGVDTSGKATSFIRRLVDGKEIKLEYDRQGIDKDGQVLAYVYCLDGTFLNAEVIKQGYARINKDFTFEYNELFKRYQEEAKEKKKGIWSD